MSVRLVDGKCFGRLGPYQETNRPGLYASQSGLVHVLGEGHVGGKGAGCLYLDQAKTTGLVKGYEVPRTLVVCDDILIGGASPDLAAIRMLLDVIKETGLTSPLAIRSSAQVEDQLGKSAAGVFETEFHGLTLDSEASIKAFVDKLLRVRNSAYAERARNYWAEAGYADIPPMPVVIQEVVGRPFGSNLFMPTMAGIVNTAARKSVRVATVLGLGISAVGEEGLGILHKLPILEDGHYVYHNMGHYLRELNDKDVAGVDLASGLVGRLKGEEASAIFDNEMIEKVRWQSPGLQQALSSLGLQFERLLGFPVDIEWASRANQLTRESLPDINLVQLRPTKKLEPIKRPEVAADKILLETQDVVGNGEGVFTRVICFQGGCPFEDVLKEMAKNFPNSLFIGEWEITRYASVQIQEILSSYCGVVVIDTLADDRHLSGTGIQHLGLYGLEKDKQVLYTHQWTLLDKVRELGTLIPNEGPVAFLYDEYQVYQLKKPIHLVADGEEGWGMVYV